jgi:hypothetical protein
VCVCVRVSTYPSPSFAETQDITKETRECEREGERERGREGERARAGGERARAHASERESARKKKQIPKQ